MTSAARIAGCPRYPRPKTTRMTNGPRTMVATAQGRRNVSSSSLPRIARMRSKAVSSPLMRAHRRLPDVVDGRDRLDVGAIEGSRGRDLEHLAPEREVSQRIRRCVGEEL